MALHLPVPVGKRCFAGTTAAFFAVVNLPLAEILLARPNLFSRFPYENPFVDRRIPALYDESHLIWRVAMTCLTLRCSRMPRCRR
jgi:hypothetical protein